MLKKIILLLAFILLQSVSYETTDAKADYSTDEYHQYEEPLMYSYEYFQDDLKIIQSEIIELLSNHSFYFSMERRYELTMCQLNLDSNYNRDLTAFSNDYRNYVNRQQGLVAFLRLEECYIEYNNLSNNKGGASAPPFSYTPPHSTRLLNYTTGFV